MKLFLYLFLFLVLIFLFYPKGYFVLNTYKEGHQSTKEKEGFGIGAYIINLDRSKERLDYVLPKIKELNIPYERISAVEGKLLSESEIQEKVDFKSYKNFMGHIPSRGTVGCSLSHLKAWETFLQSPYQYALIFEDDVTFTPKDLLKSVYSLTENSKNWDLVNFETYHSGMPVSIDKINKDKDLVLYLTHVTHAGCYLISRKTAQKLIQKYLPIKMPIDHYFTRGWELDIRFTGVEPRLVSQSFGDSEINQTSSKYSFSRFEGGKLFNKILYKGQTYVMTFLYNLKEYIIAKLFS